MQYRSLAIMQFVKIGGASCIRFRTLPASVESERRGNSCTSGFGRVRKRKEKHDNKTKLWIFCEESRQNIRLLWKGFDDGKRGKKHYWYAAVYAVINCRYYNSPSRVINNTIVFASSTGPLIKFNSFGTSKVIFTFCNKRVSVTPYVQSSNRLKKKHTNSSPNEQ